jgi:hypothetical protein
MTAGAVLDRSGSSTFTIWEIVNLAREGSIRVPSFQRAFGWDAADVLRLFDSLYRGFPIGTILLWKQQGPRDTISFGRIQIDVAERSDALFVVDGQQRIASLFGSLSPNHREVDERFEVYFDLSTQRFVNPRRGVVPSRSIPVREASETRRLLNWLRQHEDDLQAEDFDVADRLGGVLRDYRIPAYIVIGDNQNLLREVFDRVNSAGKPITRAQVFHALFAGDAQPGSPAMVVKELHGTHFGTLDENRVVQSLLAIRGGNVQRDIREEFEENEDPFDWYDRTEQALVRAIGFLRVEGVHHMLLMPNTLPLPVLAAFFFLHPEPSTWVLQLLSRWLWRGWVHGFGWRESGQTPALRRAVSAINPRKGALDQAPAEYDAVEALLTLVADRAAPAIPLSNFKTNSGNGRLILLALAALRPKGPDGQVLDLAALLEQHGANAVTDFVPGRRSYAAARGFWRAGEPSISSGTDRAILQSHLIDGQAAQALSDDNIEEFVRIRGAALSQQVDRFLENKLQSGAIIRPPLQELVAAGNAEDN